MLIGIVDVGIGNIGSLKGALYSQGWDIEIVKESSQIQKVSHLILPGVGSFANAMKKLNSNKLVDSIQNFVKQGMPLMGICLGMQLLAEYGQEGGGYKGLGLIEGEVIKLNTNEDLRLPHVGWNVMNHKQVHPLLKGIKPNVDFYFVHSYFFSIKNKINLICTTEYGFQYPSFVGKDNVVGVQFHPEKSQRNGLKLLDNFCLWDGKC